MRTVTEAKLSTVLTGLPDVPRVVTGAATSPPRGGPWPSWMTRCPSTACSR